jgi:hypothetical protein
VSLCAFLSLCSERLFADGKPVTSIDTLRRNTVERLYSELFDYYNGNSETSNFTDIKHRWNNIQLLIKETSGADLQSLLQRVMTDDPSPKIRQRITKIAGEMGEFNEPMSEVLVTLLINDSDFDVRQSAFVALRKLCPEGAKEERLLLSELEESVRDYFPSAEFAKALGKVNLRIKKKSIQLEVLGALADMGALTAQQIAKLVELARTFDPEVYNEALSILATAEIETPETIKLFEEKLNYFELDKNETEYDVSFFLFKKKHGIFKALRFAIAHVAYFIDHMSPEAVQSINEEIARVVMENKDDARRLFQQLASNPVILKYPPFLELFSRLMTGRPDSICAFYVAERPLNTGNLRLRKF